jgi:pimeloyl-ACP methyl ester carboxylesterase
MARPVRMYVPGDYGQVHVRIATPENPSAPPLYCAHQSPKNGREFEIFMAEASRERIVVAPDYPGYGMSDAPPREADATIPLYARTLWEVADHFGHTKLDVFGNHTGGKVATEMALQQPDRMRGIVMVSAAILTDAEREAFTDYFSPVPLDEAGTRFTTMWKRIMEVRGAGQTLELLALSLQMNLMGGEAYEWGHAAAFAYAEPFERALRELPHRITILNPTDSLTEATRRAAALVRNGAVVEMPHWGFGFMDTDTKAAVACVLNALDKS